MRRLQVLRLAPFALFALFAVGALIATLAFPQPAWAHGQLAVSTPAQGGTLTEPTETVLLAFTEKPAPFAYFTVTAPSGARVDGPWSFAEPYRLDEPAREYNLVNGVWEPRLFHTAFPVKVPVAHWPEQGIYTMRYQSVASDGDEVKGQVRFTYAGAMTPAPAGWLPPTNQPSPELLAAAGQAQAPPGAASMPSGATVAAPQTRSVDAWVWFLPAVLLVGITVLIGRRKPAAGQRKRG